ncbi:324_t:CDS:10 [Entrophospora sp. SA101]|nr:324_t:CDS:10 [Entrophospora sp. SA101]
MGKFIANIINDFLNRVRGILGTQEPEFCQKLEDEFYQPEADDQKGKKSASAPRSLKSDFTGGLIISGSSSSSVNSEDLYKKLEKALEIFNQVVDGRGEIENFFRQIEKITDAENSQLENIKKEELTNSSISDDIAKFKRLTREIEVLTRQIKVAEENLKRTPEEDRDEKNTRAKDEDNNNSVQLSGNIRRLADKIENIVGSLKGEEGKKQLKEYNENTENQEKFKNELSDKYGLDLPHSLFLEEDGKIKEREAGKVYLRDVYQNNCPFLNKNPTDADHYLTRLTELVNQTQRQLDNTQLTEGTANITAVKFRQATASLIGDKLCSEENLSELDLDNSVQQIKNYFANFGIKPEDYSFFTYFPLLASQIREKDQKKVLTEGKALFWETANIEKSSEKKTEKTGETPIIEIPLDTTNDGIHKKIFVNGNLANPLTVEITGLDKIHKHASKYFATYKIQPVIVSIVEDGNTRNININELNLLYKEINFEPDYNMTEEENKCVVRAEVPGLIEEFVDFNNHSSLKIGENKIIQVGDEIQIKFTASEDNKKTDKEGNIELKFSTQSLSALISQVRALKFRNITDVETLKKIINKIKTHEEFLFLPIAEKGRIITELEAEFSALIAKKHKKDLNKISESKRTEGYLPTDIEKLNLRQELRITAGISDNLKNILNTDSLLDRAELVAGYLTYYNTGNLTSDDLAKAYPIYQKIKGGEVSFADSSTDQEKISKLRAAVGLERSIEELKSLAVKFSSDYQALIPIIRELETYSEYAEEPLMIAKLKDYQKEIDTYKNSFRSVSNLPIFPPYTESEGKLDIEYRMKIEDKIKSLEEKNFPPYVGAGLEPTEYRIFQLDYNKKTAIKNQLTEIESSAKANAAAYQKELDTINEIFRKNITTDYNDSNTPTGLNLNLIEEDIATLQQFTPKAGAITALSHTQQAQGKIYKSQGKRILFWELSLLKLHYKEKNKDLLSDYEKNKLLASNKLKGLAEGFVLPNFLGEKEVKTLDNDFNQLTTKKKLIAEKSEEEARVKITKAIADSQTNLLIEVDLEGKIHNLAVRTTRIKLDTIIAIQQTRTLLIYVRRGESELANGVLDKPALTNLNDFKKSKSTDTKNQAYQAINSQSDNPNRAEKLLNALKDLKAAKESRLFDKSVAGSEADNLETREKVKAAHRLLTTLRTIRGTETLDD